MYNKKVLLAAILLILVKSAFGIEVVEVEPNNTSSLATELQLGGIENVGQLSDGNDVDFFLIKPSEISDEKGVIQYNDVSLSFACNNRALAAKNKSYGWYLTIHDDEGVLQSSYQVEPDECATGTASSKGPYNFKFPKPSSNKHGVKYYLSVVGDCRKPVFNISSNPLISVNSSDKPATQNDIDKTKKVLSDVQTVLNNTDVKIGALSESLSISILSDAIDVAQSNIISYGSDNLKNIKLPRIQSIADINIDDYLLQATDITTVPNLNQTSKAQVNAIKSTLTTVKSLLNTTSTVILSSTTTIATAKNELVAATKKITSTSIEQADIDDLIIKINNLNNEIDRLNSPIENLNTTVANFNTAVSTVQDICSTGNSANYTIKDNPDTVVAPYKTIKEQSIVLGKENSGQNGSVADVDFFELFGSTETAIPLKFSCAKNSAKGKDQGWVISAWKPNEKSVLDKPEFVYQVSPADCNAPEVYSIQLPPVATNYYIGVQSACALPPRDTATTLQSSYWYSNSTSLDFLCDANTANFTLARDFKTAVPLILDEEKTGEMNSRSDYDLFVVENNAAENYSINFYCGLASNETQWKISIYDDADKLVPSYPKLIKGTECKTTGLKLDKLPKNATHYYISIEPSSISATPDTSKYTIKKEKIIVQTDVPTSSGTTVILGETKLFSILEKGQITKTKEGFSVLNYYVDGSAKKETTLVFACNNPKVLFSNNWNVSVYNSDKTLRDSYIVNSSDCLPDSVTGESSYTITIPKESARFYIQIKSMCDVEDTSCKLDDSIFTITRKPDISTPSVVKTSDAFDTAWLASKKNLGASLKTAQVQSLTDAQIYQVDTGTEDANLTFSCNDSVRYQNDWKLLIYDSAKTLKSTTMINGSSCGMGQNGDTGAYAILLTKNSPTYYLVVKSACDTDDKTCEIDKSSYQLKRITATQAATNAATKPCFGTNCAAVTTPVKPFFSAPTTK